MLVKYVKYHSTEWALAVEMGWRTDCVDDNGYARMVK